MNSINILDSLTINKIAAGEVIENPASVIKELVENAIDAKASSIFVEIQNGGKTYMRITDDGYGISKLDIRKAFMRHATSKIQKVEDLNQVLSLGFRGEALASIAAVSKVKMTTKKETEKNGHFIEFEGGSIVDEGDIGATKGTTIVIRDLFYNIPVRKNFLKTDKGETSKISEVIHKMALSNPSISFKYVRDDKVIFRTAGNDELKSVIYALFGRDCAKSMLKIEANANNLICDGFISDSSFTKGSRSYFFTYINGRYVFSPVINKAIEEAYKSYIMLKMFPAVFINLQIDPKFIDVNIHPKKLEVKFQNSDEIFNFIYRSVKDIIQKQMQPKELDLNKERTYKKPIKNQPLNIDEMVKKEIGQEADFRKSLDVLNQDSGTIDLDLFNVKETDKNLDLFNVKKTRTETFETNSSMNPANKPLVFESTNNDSDKFNDSNNYSTSNSKQEYKQDKTAKQDFKRDLDQNLNLISKIVTKSEDGQSETNQMEFTHFDVFGNAPVLQVDKIDDEDLQQIAVKKLKFKDRIKKLPDLQYKGNLFNTYILAEEVVERELFIIDQHAAHERVNYEKFLVEFENEELVLQELMTPEVIHLSNFELELAMEYHKELERLGFELEEFGTNSIIMRAIPMIFGQPDTGKFLKDIIGNLENLNGNFNFKLEKIMKIACTQSVKAGQNLQALEVQQLLEDLSKCEDPYTCPHGRPTIVKLTKQEIEKYFKRIL